VNSFSVGSKRVAIRRIIGGAVFGLILHTLPLHGQLPPLPSEQDTVVRADTTDPTGLLLEKDEDTKVRLPVAPRMGTADLLPPHSRVLFPRDSIDFMNAETVGDVLSEIPGVFMWRGGWLGRAELPNFLGRGATSVEWIVDGVPYTPMGLDSLSVDPTTLPLGFVERIEVERLPGLLRVHLMLRQHNLLAPWTRIGVARGTYDQALYEGMLQKRARSGLGFALGASYTISEGFKEFVGNSQISHGWLEGSYIPSERFGARVRYRLSAPERDPSYRETGTASDTVARALDGNRKDVEARVFLRQRPDLLGNQADFIISRSSWALDSTLEQSLLRVGAVVSMRGPTRSLGASLWYGSRWTQLDARVRGGWSPTEHLSAAVEGALQQHTDSRNSRWVLLRGGLTLPLGASLSGAWRLGQQVARPKILGDTAQSLSDREIRFGFDRSWIGAEVSYTRLAQFQPVSFYQFAQIDSIATPGSVEWLTASARLAPRQWLTLQGWYSTPRRGEPEGMPPTHSMITATIRSKFLRTFPSGIFDLKLELAVENWGTGTLGRDVVGDPVTINGATFMRGLIQMRFSQFIIYYDRYNLANTRSSYIPGLRQPTQGYTFGVRWAFLN
jgi:hypothetical protein